MTSRYPKRSKTPSRKILSGFAKYKGLMQATASIVRKEKNMTIINYIEESLWEIVEYVTEPLLELIDRLFE